MTKIRISSKFILIAITLFTVFTVQAKQALQFKDVFNFKAAKSTQLSENGNILALSATPYRGDAQGQVYDLTTNQVIASATNGYAPVINKSADWVAFEIKPSLLTIEQANKKDRKKLKKSKSLTLVQTSTAKQVHFSDVIDFQLSHDGHWLAYRHKNKIEKNGAKVLDKHETEAAKTSQEAKELLADKSDKAYPLFIVNLTNEKQFIFDSVVNYNISPNSTFLAFNQVFEDLNKNNISIADLANNNTLTVIADEPGIHANQMTWHPTQDILAFSAGNYNNQDTRRRPYHLYLWEVSQPQLTEISPVNSVWYIGKTAKLTWSEQGQRLYYQSKPVLKDKAKKDTIKSEADLFNYDIIRQQRQLALWHPNDDYIKPREKVLWHRENKERHYQAVYHLASQNNVQLNSPSFEKLYFHTEKKALLARNSKPYLQQASYQDNYADYYAIDTVTGTHKLVQTKAFSRPSLSPNGKYAVYLLEGDIVLKNLENDKVTRLVSSKDLRFSDDKHDYPRPDEGYGIAGWMQDESAVLVYSKHDIWSFNTTTFKGMRLTQGAKSNIRYRVKWLDKKKTAFTATDKLYLHAKNLIDKQTGIAQFSLAEGKLTQLASGEVRYSLIKKAKHSDTLLFTKQDYHTFPDIWQTNNSFKQVQKITQLNPQTSDFTWGEKPELISYKGWNGEELQGTLIKPAGYQKGDKVPVLIYFYRYMSHRHYNFPDMKLNHRPNLPMFTSNGYAVFLPDIRFEIGYPGLSSTKTMINAAKKLIDLGVAHPDKIGLQGHSWAGYQSAFMITQTDMFKAVVSGAPVSNMTSAYGGIRLKSGKTRQFQYETGQSRLGKSLFEAPELYIENSPLFYADKVNTPILIMFGDRDDAVPWHEGVQYYLALQRAGKDAMFLQYHDEPHHLKQFANQLDFSIRSMEYFEHHLKGKPKAEWMLEGEAYQNEEKKAE